MVPHLPLLQTTPQILVGHRALDVKLIAMHNVSLLPAVDNQALQAQWLAVSPFIPKPPNTAWCQAVSPIPLEVRETSLRKRTMPRQARVRSRPQAMSRRHPMVKTSRIALTPKTPSLVLISSSASTRLLTPSLTLER